MPTYEYRCDACNDVTARVFSMSGTPREVDCETCGATAHKIISRVSVRLSNLSKMEKLDPKYDKMVDSAMRKTQSADPDNYLKRMKPFGHEKRRDT